MFSLSNKNYLCIVDYHSKFPIIKKMEDLLADSLILACIIIFSEYGLSRKIMSDTGANFISEKFEKFCRKLNIECAVSSSYHHKSNGQEEASIKLIKHKIKKCHYTNSDIHLGLMQIRMMPLGPGLPNPATLLFNHPTRGIMPIIYRILIRIDNGDDHHEALVKRQTKNDTKYDTARIYSVLPIGSTLAVQREDSDRWTLDTIVGKGDYNHHD